MAAALVLETSAFGRVGSSPTWGTKFSYAQVAKRSKASDCKSDRETSREFNPRPVLHFFSFHASVAHLDRAPSYEPGGGKFESFQTRHLFPYKQTGCMRLAVNQHRARFDASVRSHFDVGFSSAVELRVVIPAVISSNLISQPKPLLHDAHSY